MLSNILNTENSLLLLVDIQEKLLAAIKKSEDIRNNSVILAKAASILELPVVITEQYPKGLGNTIDRIKLNLPPDTDIVEKTGFNCFEADGFEAILEKHGKKQIIVCGIEAHICVHQTVTALLQKGYEVHVVKDAVVSRTKENYKAGLARMYADGAVQTTTEIVLFEWLKSAKHPKFKEVQGLIK